ncbi:MAG: ATP-binding protein [Acidimicrobiales bacterium]
MAGESRWPVPPLAVPDAGTVSSDGLCESDAARLFVERASAADPGFSLSHDNAPAVADICRALDGLPLAIELAAARTRSLSVQDIATHLRDRFRLLVGTDPTAPDRHRTLRHAVDWSYGALSAAEQRLFRHASVFAGGFTLDAAAAVGGEDDADVLDGLAALVDQSLVGADRSGASTRYRLLETLRQYGAEQLAASASRTRCAPVTWHGCAPWWSGPSRSWKAASSRSGYIDSTPRRTTSASPSTGPSPTRTAPTGSGPVARCGGTGRSAAGSTRASVGYWR